jgi:hypothetical protein
MPDALKAAARSVSYTNWKRGSPDNGRTREHHAQYLSEGAWNDADGADGRQDAFVCEWNSAP